VNVTAAWMSIGEFQEVGQIVKQFRSEDATVVVGTVIDPELENQLLVTVVATGLGRPTAAVRAPLTYRASARQAGKPRSPRRAAPSRRCVWCGAQCRAATTRRSTSPTVQAAGGGGWAAPGSRSRILLDIPAFCGGRPIDVIR